MSKRSKPVFSKIRGQKGGEVAAHLRSTETWAVEQLLARFKAWKFEGRSLFGDRFWKNPVDPLSRNSISDNFFSKSARLYEKGINTLVNQRVV